MIINVMVQGRQQPVMPVEDLVDFFGVQTVRLSLLEIAEKAFVNDDVKDETSSVSMFILMKLIQGFEVKE